MLSRKFSGWRVVAGEFEFEFADPKELADEILEFSVVGDQPGAERRIRMPFARVGKTLLLSYQGRVFTVAPQAVGRRMAKRAAGALTAPMMGVVSAVLVEEGTRVKAHDPIMVIEAMKVMATIEAPFAGTVTALHFQKGDVVPHGEVVADIDSGKDGTE